MTEVEKKYPFTVKILLNLEIDLHNFRAIRKDLATIYELSSQYYVDQNQCDKAIAKYIAKNVY